MSFGTSFRPGDWVCLECNFHNYASRDSCHNCGRGKRPSASSVDYVDAAGGGEYHGIRPAEHQGVVSRWPDSDSHALTLRRAMLLLHSTHQFVMPVFRTFSDPVETLA